jgi:hypothetical protein
MWPRVSFRVVLTVLLPVSLGAVIYLSWRTETLLVFRWVQWLGAGSLLHTLRAAAHGVHPSRALLNCLPDGMWVFAFTSAMRFIWLKPNTALAFCWMFLPLALALGGEFGQFLHNVPGTFDYTKIGWLLAAISFMIALVLF